MTGLLDATQVRTLQHNRLSNVGLSLFMALQPALLKLLPLVHGRYVDQ